MTLITNKATQKYRLYWRSLGCFHETIIVQLLSQCLTFLLVKLLEVLHPESLYWPNAHNAFL